MRPRYTNQPINKPARRREPAVKTLAVMSTVLAMMFGVKLFYDPAGPGTAESAAVGAEPQDGPKKIAGDTIMVGGLNGDYDAEYNDPVAACMAAGGAALPHAGEISSGFAVREDPFGSGETEFHRGIDIAGEGEVRAWSGGTVEDVGENESYGNYVTVRHSGRVVGLAVRPPRLRRLRGGLPGKGRGPYRNGGGYRRRDRRPSAF